MKSCNLLKIFLAALIFFSFCTSAFAWREGFGKRGKEYDVQAPPPTQSGPSQEEVDRARRQEAEQRRQQIEAEEAEKARQSQEAFRQKKQEALDMMKGVTEGELGLKGAGPAGSDDLGLKGGDEAQPAAPRRKAAARAKTREPLDSSTVDLRHLDPNRPIVVDPNVVKGKQRVFSVQVSQETLNNASYKKGCEAFMNRDPEAALKYFQQAQKERPGDPLVRAQILLAQDLIKVRQQEAKKQFGAYKVAFDGVHAARNGDYPEALVQFQRAHELNPQEKIIARWKRNLEVLNLDLKKLESDPGLSPKEKDTEMRAMNLAGNAMVALMRGDYRTAQVVLGAAQKMEPQSKCLQVLQEAVAEKRRTQEAVKNQVTKKKISQRN
jgi:hypothetical protein